MMTKKDEKKPPHRPWVSNQALMKGTIGITPELNDWYKKIAPLLGKDNGTALRRAVLEAFRELSAKEQAEFLERGKK